eukprot:jgi/Mesvir1/20612/Mv14840-RA.1
MGGKYSIPDVKSVYFTEETKKLPEMSGKTVVITGTTTGLGLVTAKLAASKGARVFALNRPSKRADDALNVLRQAAVGPKPVHINCDLQSFESVRAAAAEVAKLTEKEGVDVLLNNAGIMALPDDATKDGYDVQMQTNHLSHFLLTSLLFGSLEKAAARNGQARVVNHTSIARKTPGTRLDAKHLAKTKGKELGGYGARWERYHQTKLANAVFTLALQDKLDTAGKKGILALMAHPGFAASNLQATTAEAGMGAGLSMLMRFAQSAEDGALPLIQCMLGKDVKGGDLFGPAHKGMLGWLMGDGTYGPAKRFEPEALCTDAASKQMLWEASEKAVGPFRI